MNFRYKLMRFMSGRYGVDAMFFVLLFLSLTISIINIFLRLIILQLITDIIIIYAVFRALSRNIAARRRENAWAIKLFQKINQRQSLKRRMQADYNHIYKKCPKCRAVLRLPRKQGKHKTVCPKCDNEFSVRVK